MSSDRDRFRVELEVDPAARRQSPGQSAESFGPFRIAVIGDFSGRSSRGAVESRATPAAPRAIRVDRDSLEDAMAELNPTLTIAHADAAPSEITFSSLDDFHPDRLYERLPYFRALRDHGARVAASASIAPPASPTTPVGVLDAILGDAPPPPGGAALAKAASHPATSRVDDGLAELISRALSPHLVATPSGAEEEASARTDASIESAMRVVLHHPDFQRLEALWRGLEFLVRRLDTGSTLQLYLIDATVDGLRADLADGPVEGSATYRLLVDGKVGTPGMPAWAVVAAAFSLGADDAELVGRLGAIARDAGAVLLAGADPRLAGAEDLGASTDADASAGEPSGWSAVRRSDVAPYIGLLFPRLLLRLPYGKSTEPCERFPFEEFSPTTPAKHEEFLWGSGAFAGALVIGEGFADAGWSLRPSREISDLPLYVAKVEGEFVATPCAEAVLGERAAERLLDRGITPLLTVRDSYRVILPRLQSIAATPTALMGRWNASGHGRRD
jgi:type VI secretion system protein ImpC